MMISICESTQVTVEYLGISIILCQVQTKCKLQINQNTFFSDLGVKGGSYSETNLPVGFRSFRLWVLSKIWWMLHRKMGLRLQWIEH